MKLAFRTLLVIAVCAMCYLCVTSITVPIEFEQEQAKREQQIIKKLVDIRKVQIEYQKINNHFCPNADTLVQFILEGQLPVILKEGVLSDEQLKNGLTEKKAIAIIKRGNQKEIIANGLENFRRDTTYVSVYESILANDYTKEQIADLVVIPHSNGTKFQFDTITYVNANTGLPTPLFQVSAHYDTYLFDLNRQQLINLKDKQTKMNRFNGLKVGSVEEPNNNSGNWE
ncbi:MAG: hypothetical protein J6R43_05565 [Paludibacteraceae bacterium]|jgi:hypothetical protein|nr:hypothetical protein [Paludibacteraceae bacterium]MBQ5925219.1 hypothetical protein [Paludibacteraceae bacterium]